MKRVRRFLNARTALVAFALLGLSIGLTGCPKAASTNTSPNRRQDAKQPISIVCTTGMVADVVKNVGGDQVKVQLMMKEGVDPHTYQPSRGDVSALNDAHMIYFSGLHLEANLLDTFKSLGRSKPVFEVTQAISRWHHDELLSVDESHDPHIWMDVSLWAHTVKYVADRLADYDPENAEKYAANARQYLKQLDELHRFCKSELGTIPAGQRVLVTAHDAFSYFAKAYGMTVKAVQGISTESEASTAKIDDLATYLKENNIKAVFVESSVNKRNMEQLIASAKSKGHTVTEGGVLYSDAMGKEGTEAGTYEGMIRHNVKTIVKALK